MPRRHAQTPEEEDAGLICLGEVYQDIESPGAEIYLRIKTDKGTVAYQFRNPEVLWSKILKWCDSAKPMPECDE